MTSFEDYEQDKPIKAMNIGDSGAGKTGALVSLVLAGYHVFVIDYDNGIDVIGLFLKKAVAEGKLKKEHLSRAHYKTITPKLKAGAAAIVNDGTPDTYKRTMSVMQNWVDERPDGRRLSYGNVGTWGRDTVLVIDSLTRFGDACLDYILALQGRVKPQIQDWGEAMDLQKTLIELVCSESINCHVIVNAHLIYNNDPSGAVLRGYPSALGQKLPPKIGQFFNTLVLTESRGSGQQTKRYIRTNPTSLIELKNPMGNDLPTELDLGTAWAEFFRKAYGPDPGFDSPGPSIKDITPEAKKEK